MNDQNLDKQSSLHPETLAIRIQQKRGEREHSVPLYMTSSFVFDDAEQARAMFADEIQGNIYTRFSNPNVNEFIEKLTVLELAEDGIGTASGMSAVFTGMAALLKSGDHIVAARSVFGSTHQILVKILPKWGITHTYIEGSTREEWENAIQPNTKMFFLETPSNPGLQLYDLEMIGKLANEKGIKSGDSYQINNVRPLVSQNGYLLSVINANTFELIYVIIDKNGTILREFLPDMSEFKTKYLPPKQINDKL